MSEAADLAICAVEMGRLVDCEAADWPEVRRALQDQAGKWLDWGDDMRAQVALCEVQRLDSKFRLSGGPPAPEAD